MYITIQMKVIKWRKEHHHMWRQKWPWLPQRKALIKSCREMSYFQLIWLMDFWESPSHLLLDADLTNELKTDIVANVLSNCLKISSYHYRVGKSFSLGSSFIAGSFKLACEDLINALSQMFQDTSASTLVFFWLIPTSFFWFLDLLCFNVEVCQSDGTKCVMSNVLTEPTESISGGWEGGGWWEAKWELRPGRAIDIVYSHQEEF